LETLRRKLRLRETLRLVMTRVVWFGTDSLKVVQKVVEIGCAFRGLSLCGCFQ
jgi:hypothetical protein